MNFENFHAKSKSRLIEVCLKAGKTSWQVLQDFHHLASMAPQISGWLQTYCQVPITESYKHLSISLIDSYWISKDKRFLTNDKPLKKRIQIHSIIRFRDGCTRSSLVEVVTKTRCLWRLSVSVTSTSRSSWAKWYAEIRLQRFKPSNETKNTIGIVLSNCTKKKLRFPRFTRSWSGCSVELHSCGGILQVSPDPGFRGLKSSQLCGSSGSPYSSNQLCPANHRWYFRMSVRGTCKDSWYLTQGCYAGYLQSNTISEEKLYEIGSQSLFVPLPQMRKNAGDLPAPWHGKQNSSTIHFENLHKTRSSPTTSNDCMTACPEQSGLPPAAHHLSGPWGPNVLQTRTQFCHHVHKSTRLCLIMLELAKLEINLRVLILPWAIQGTTAFAMQVAVLALQVLDVAAHLQQPPNPEAKKFARKCVQIANTQQVTLG